MFLAGLNSITVYNSLIAIVRGVVAFVNLSLSCLLLCGWSEGRYAGFFYPEHFTSRINIAHLETQRLRGSAMTATFIPAFTVEALTSFMEHCSEEDVTRALTLLHEQYPPKLIVSVHSYLVNGRDHFIARGFGRSVKDFICSDTLELHVNQEFSVGQNVWYHCQLRGGYRYTVSLPATILKINAKTITVLAVLTTEEKHEYTVKRESLRPRSTGSEVKR